MELKKTYNYNSFQKLASDYVEEIGIENQYKVTINTDNNTIFINQWMSNVNMPIGKKLFNIFKQDIENINKGEKKCQ